MIVLLVFAVVLAFVMKFISNRKIGGVTGDVLGALNELTELGEIILLATIL